MDSLKLKKWHDRHEFLIWIVLAVLLLRIPSLFEPYWYGDEGVYMTLGLALKKGLVWYRDIHDNKPPLLYLMAYLGGSLMWLRMILLIWNGINVFIFGKLAEKILRKRFWACGATLAFGLLTTLPWMEGNIANAEVFMIGPVVAAVWRLLEIRDKRLEIKNYLIVGGLLSVAVLFKVPAIFDVFAVLVWLVFFQKKIELKKAFWVGVGVAVPILATIGYYFLVGAGGAYIRAAFLQNIGYLASWRMGTGGQSGLMVRGVIALVTTGLVWWLTRSAKSERRLIYVWVIWALFGALLSERPYPHYLLQVVPAGILAIGMMVASRKFRRVDLAGAVVLVLVMAGIINYKFGFYSAKKYYGNFLALATGKIEMKTYFNNFDARATQTYAVAKYLKGHTEKNERIFVWGNEPYIYSLSERLPVGRYTVAYHIEDFRGREETIKALVAVRPKYIVTFDYEKNDFGELNSLLTAWYTLVAEVEQANIYRLVE